MSNLKQIETPGPVQPLLHVALLEPEIPPNTGNIARLCAATGTRLHLIGRLGFKMDDRNLKRAGCDYWPLVDVQLHASWEDFEQMFASARIFAFSARATQPYTVVAYQPGDVLLFGPESRGLPASLQEKYANRLLCLPMPAGGVRSLNLATAVGIALYEGLRQLGAW
jgi:tRNA (cytidine/uridine-2'-O-)-methyltransferase